MRFVLELTYTDRGIEGEVTADGQSVPHRFSSWLELLRLLERPGSPHEVPDPR